MRFENSIPKDRARRQKVRRRWLRQLRRGDVISACYDGKGGRAVRAIVIKQRKGVVIAEFQRWAGEGITRVRFVDGGGWDADGETMPMFGVSRLGDWYAIWSIDDCPPREDGAAEKFVSAVKVSPAAALAAVLCNSMVKN